VNLQDGTGCADGDVCNGDETCQSGDCAAGAPLVCNDGDPCTDDGCDATDGCTTPPAPDGTGCGDGDACNGPEACVGGQCASGNPLDCDDDDVCTIDFCDADDGCTYAPAADDTPCVDGDVCNGDEHCVSGECATGTPPVCDDGNVCTADLCDAQTGCDNFAVGGDCSDGDECNGLENCFDGECTAGTPLVCDDGNVCTADSCHADHGCETTPLVDGTSCADDDVCNGAEICQGATCTSGASLQCEDGNDCTLDSCDAVAGCQTELAPDGALCDDLDACTTGDHCDGAGVCQHDDNSCSGPALDAMVLQSGAGYTEVVLPHTYSEMVVVCGANYGAGAVPAVVRVRNAVADSFEFAVMAADKSDATIEGVSVHCVVVEAGVYTAGVHGVTMEAVRFTSTTTDRKGLWSAQARTYANSYAKPAVVGQVMSDNDPRWSVFWARGNHRKNPPTAGVLRAGKHVGEDSRKTRADELIGYIVIESGFGALGGHTISAGLGADTIRGYHNAPPFNYAIATSAPPIAAVVSAAAMDGGNGGWPILFGDPAVTSSQLGLAYEEDTAKDAERKHVTEQAAYLVVQ